MAQCAIFVHGHQWASFDSTLEALECRRLMSSNNRWWKEHRNHVEIGNDQQGLDAPASDPYQRWWSCCWIPGRAGWDLTPLTDGRYRTEAVQQNDREAQVVFVTAPTASLAQERAVFMLMEGKKTR